jgi:hypothetical protein
MAQMTWRASEELLDRVRRQAQEHGKSLNDWVTTVMAAASDPAHAGDHAEQLRERLARAGLLQAPVGAARRRPSAARIARARAAAGQGTPPSELVSRARG